MLGYENIVLKYKGLWLIVGLSMVMFIVYSSLVSDPLSVDMGFEWQDKVLHTVGYFGVMGWFVQIYHQQKARYILALVFIAMGISLEFLQDFGGVRCQYSGCVAGMVIGYNTVPEIIELV